MIPLLASDGLRILERENATGSVLAPVKGIWEDDERAVYLEQAGIVALLDRQVTAATMQHSSSEVPSARKTSHNRLMSHLNCAQHITPPQYKILPQL
jgi:hypothetical protein